jgi:hypothetical protein
MDLILGDKGRNIGEAHAGLYKTVRKLISEDYMSVLKPFFDIEQFETRAKKYVHFVTDGVSVSVLLGEECKPKPKLIKPRGNEERMMMNLLYHQLVMMLGLDLIQDCIICLSQRTI